jgi:hypothetical protein
VALVVLETLAEVTEPGGLGEHHGVELLVAGEGCGGGH